MLRWLRRNKRYGGSTTVDTAVPGGRTLPAPEPPVIVDRLTEQELKLIFSAQQLAEAARVAITGFLAVQTSEGARRAPIGPGVAHAVLADRLRDFDEAEMAVWEASLGADLTRRTDR
jgi:hypothetical protein